MQMKFLDKRTNRIRKAYSVEENDEKIFVEFTENGKIYAYNPENIEIIDELQADNSNRIYQFKQLCYRCKQNTIVYTYIVFSDNSKEDVTFPWDKKRLLRNQNAFLHLEDPSIEY